MKRLMAVAVGIVMATAGVQSAVAHEWRVSPGCNTHKCARHVWRKSHPHTQRATDRTTGWAIPAYVVMCESRGQNLPPNGAGASGYYQIIPSTWLAYGGGKFASQAYLATKAQQDQIAARIWQQGGAGQWDCA